MTPEAVTGSIERLDFSAATLTELARFVKLIEAQWPLATLQALKARQETVYDHMNRYGPSEPIYRPPEDPTPIGPVLDALGSVDFASFTPGHVDRIAKVVTGFGSVSTWHQFAKLTEPAKQDPGSDE